MGGNVGSGPVHAKNSIKELASDPMCSGCDKVLKWSNYAGDPYARFGWTCDQCGTAGRFGYRWFCGDCRSDICGECCHAPPTDDPPPTKETVYSKNRYAALASDEDDAENVSSRSSDSAKSETRKG